MVGVGSIRGVCINKYEWVRWVRPSVRPYGGGQSIPHEPLSRAYTHLGRAKLTRRVRPSSSALSMREMASSASRWFSYTTKPKPLLVVRGLGGEWGWLG